MLRAVPSGRVSGCRVNGVRERARCRCDGRPGSNRFVLRTSARVTGRNAGGLCALALAVITMRLKPFGVARERPERENSVPRSSLTKFVSQRAMYSADRSRPARLRRTSKFGRCTSGPAALDGDPTAALLAHFGLGEVDNEILESAAVAANSDLAVSQSRVEHPGRSHPLMDHLNHVRCQLRSLVRICNSRRIA